jgi:streptogramin lyase
MSTDTRKAPTASATLFKNGTIKKGNDGNKWMIVTDTRGVQRWQKINVARKNRTMKQRKSARVLQMESDPNTVWGKNKPLEHFWQDLASGRNVVVIYAKPSFDGAHKIVDIPKGKVATRTMYDSFDADPNIVAVLSSNMSQDAYEVYLYPKAREQTVEYVIRNYKKFFKSSGSMPADLVENGIPAQRKVFYPA